MTLFAVLKSAVANPSLKRPYTGANRSRACAMWASLSPQSRETRGSTQFPRMGPLLPRDVERSLQRDLRRFGGVRAAIFQNFHPLDAQDLRSAPARFTCLGAGDCFPVRSVPPATC